MMNQNEDTQPSLPNNLSENLAAIRV